MVMLERANMSRDTGHVERGWGFCLLMGGLAVPAAAVLTWALLLLLNVVFGVPISLDWAFGIVILAGLLAGPAVVAWLVRRRRPRPHP